MLLSEISQNVNDSLQEAMIGSIVQNVTANAFQYYKYPLIYYFMQGMVLLN